jgi:S1-C subfamily serine protease
MRSNRPVALALVAAAVGAAGVLAIAKATGWIGSSSGRVQTVFVTQPVPAAASAALAPHVKPLVGGTFDPALIYARRSPGVVTIFSYFGPSAATATEAAQGSGFVVSPQGYILTNSHVITNAGTTAGGPTQPASQIYVEFQDHDRVAAKVVGWDVFDDVGVLRVDPKAHPLEPVPLGDSAAVVVGEPVAVIGSPFGNENSLAVGVVSAVHRSIQSLTSDYDLIDAIQTDAPINHGNSGGPLFDARGRAIGISAQIRSDSGNAEGVGFAVPINSARRSMQELVANGRVAYAYVGITTEDLTPTAARHFGYPVKYGAVIDEVRSGTAGASAGLRGGTHEEEYAGSTFTRGGDVIVSIAGEPVRNAEDVVRIVTDDLVPGQTARFVVFRGQKRQVVTVKLSARPGGAGAQR